MQIVVNKGSKLVVYSGTSFQWVPYLICPQFMDSQITEATHEIIDVVTLPEPWLDGHYSYDGGEFFVVVPLPLPSISEYTTAVQAHLDDTAAERNYDGILSLCTYAGSQVAKFQAEGRAGLAWRDAVWAKCYEIMGTVQAGQLIAPTVAGLLSELPELIWPS